MRAAFGPCLLVVLATGIARGAAQEEPAPAPPRPRLALALSGGGARGIAHIGALRALEEAGIPVDAIAGNSMGAVVGSIYATGRTTAELERIVRSADWATIFSGRPDRPQLPVVRRRDRYGSLAGVSLSGTKVRLPASALGEQRINRFLIKQLAPAGWAAGGDFDRLPIRFRAVATALDDGDRVVLARGDLARAVRASMSIPLAFPPVEWEGRPLVDGLVVDNLPVGVARAFGAPVVVAVDVSRPPLQPEEYRDALGVAQRVSHLLTERRNEDFRAPADVLVRPDLGRHSATEYSGFDALITRGYETMQRAVPEIRRRLAEAGGAAPRAEPPARPPLEGTPIVEVVVRGNQRLDERLLRRTFNIPLGRRFDMEKGLRALDKVEATGLLDHAWMEFEPALEGLRIVLRVTEAPPNRVEVGLAYNDPEEARGSFRLRNRNTLGFGEETELLLAASNAETVGRLSLRGDRLIVPGLGYRVAVFSSEDRPRVFDADGDEINRARFERRGASARLQIPFGRWGLVEAGAAFGQVRSVAEPGLDYPDGTDDVGLLMASATADDLDDLLWPESGERLAIAAEWSLPELGATRGYWRASGEGRVGRRLGRRGTAQIDAFVGLSGDDLPVYDYFRIGGPRLVPGFHTEELQGAQAVAGGLSIRFRVVRALRVFVRAGAGNVFATRDQIDLGDLRWGVGGGAMLPSRVGPLAVEIGVRDSGKLLVTLWLGWN